MKKMFRMFVVMMLVVVAVLTAGCGEEEKYNKLKGEVNGIVDQVWAVGDEWERQKPKGMKYYDPVNVQHLESELKEIEALVPVYDKKVKELEKIAVKDVKLNNDFKEAKEDWDAKISVKLNGNKRFLKDIAEREANEKKAKTWDGSFGGF